ncbi:hypothetical protein [Natronorarus salvus]|uniref:hypothetical protein n=1 Tax=Natronorarus salvus TaxID=3117733 RepID=UPI002F264700
MKPDEEKIEAAREAARERREREIVPEPVGGSELENRIHRVGEGVAAVAHKLDGVTRERAEARARRKQAVRDEIDELEESIEQIEERLDAIVERTTR